MKCDDCLSLLEEYIDGEVTGPAVEQVSAHLMTCAQCASEHEALTGEQELFARYDRELNVSPAIWNAVAARTVADNKPALKEKAGWQNWFSGFRSQISDLRFAPRLGYAFSGALVLALLGLVIGLAYFRTRTVVKPSDESAKKTPIVSPIPDQQVARGEDIHQPDAQASSPGTVPRMTVAERIPRKELVTPDPLNIGADDVIVKDIANSDSEDRETRDHVAQAENLLRSVRNLQSADDDSEIDVTYEKATSRRLLSDNQTLRRDAEEAGKYPVKALLSDLEPFLVDIANLPDKAKPSELRLIKDRAQKTEIVAALMSY